MAKNNAELSELDLAGLVDELRATKQESLNLRFRNATGQLENVAAIKNARRRIVTAQPITPGTKRPRTSVGRTDPRC